MCSHGRIGKDSKIESCFETGSSGERTWWRANQSELARIRNMVPRSQYSPGSEESDGTTLPCQPRIFFLLNVWAIPVRRLTKRADTTIAASMRALKTCPWCRPRNCQQKKPCWKHKSEHHTEPSPYCAPYKLVKENEINSDTNNNAPSLFMNRGRWKRPLKNDNFQREMATTTHLNSKIGLDTSEWNRRQRIAKAEWEMFQKYSISSISRWFQSNRGRFSREKNFATCRIGPCVPSFATNAWI